MIPVDEALARVLAAVPALGTEELPPTATLGRVLAAPAHSAHPLPLFTQSAVDGYAVRQADLARLPARLPLAQHIAAGAHAQAPTLAAGSAARILTGGLLPLGADTVVRQERCQREGAHLLVAEAVAIGTDIRERGEEMPAGAELAGAGSRLGPGLIAALALGGVTRVRVHRQARVVVLVSGDEVVAGGAPLALGQVPDANGPLLAAYFQHWRLPLLRLEAVADTEAAVRAALARAFAEADLVITTGGVSVGDHDYIPAVAESLGAERLLWKVAQKPGMPLYVARRQGALLFGLPGNPASVLVNLLVYVRAALDAMAGLEPAARWSSAEAPATNLRADPQKTLWLRAVQQPDAEGRPQLRTLSGQASHMLGNLAQANALLRLPPASEGPPPAQLRWLALEE
ncbi:MAG: molybdopterin molybdenumtransferase MoeA [Nevskiaceae bacterium]|nr:MAG: molybdopterin molybdenumtransferase MoeA [Nevskiaceae bacterium]TAM21073.1 MAG: molybdopterin molybdenumtransferase MoeA [Nevskiaceae bacterium]